MAKDKEANVVKVKMDDGREVEFTGEKRLIKTSIEADGVLAVRLDFRNGETRTHKLNPALLTKFALHGAEQKLGDEISGVKDIDDAIEAIDQLMQRLDAGEWTVARGEGGGLAGASILARALVEVSGQPIKAVRDYLGGLSTKVKLALREDASVKPVIQRLEAEKAARAAARGAAAVPSVDVASHLSALRGLAPAGTPVTETAPAA